MAREIGAVPGVVERQLAAAMDDYLETGRMLKRRAPACVVTCARGSSDHAATYFKYLVETRIGIPVGSMGPSVASIYATPLKMADVPLVSISQSGASTDIVALQLAARAGGAPTLALTNTASSTLARQAEFCLALHAGEERAVAATKTFVTSLVALAALVAGWLDDAELAAAIRELPASLARAAATDWSAALVPFSAGGSLYMVARGPGFAIACEAALKLKETCRLHAEAYSAAELCHGPIELAGDDLAALVFAARDRSAASIGEAVRALRQAGAAVFVGGPREALPTVDAGHVLLDPICQVVSFYRFAEQLSVLLGRDPDRPARLAKVTVTT
ncbi:MAG: SIS domain-containing protein [Nitratireductor sp.]